MKNLITNCLIIVLLLIGGLACKNNPLAKFTKQYHCEIPGKPEPETSDEYFKRASEHMQSNNYSIEDEECVFGACSEAVRLDPKNAHALACRGSFYLAKKDYESALADLNEAIRLKPDYLIFYGARSSIYQEKGMLDEAIADISKGIEELDSHYNYSKRGDLYIQTSDYENAVKDFTEAIRLKPEHGDHYSKRAEAYRKLGKNDLAATDEQKAEELKIAENNPNPEENADSDKDLTNAKIETPDQTTSSKPISGGVLNGKAISLPAPAYPAAAKAVKAGGTVNVEVLVDEKGNVVSAKAVSGHPMLRSSSAQAAREAKFSPTVLQGKPFKVSGIIVYNFKIN